MNPVNIYRFVRFFVAIGIVVLGGVALFYLSTYTYPFIIAIFIAFFMNPLVDFFEKKARMPRGLAVLVSLLLILSIFAGLITLLVVEIVSGADYLGEVVPKHLVTVVDYIEDLIVKQILPLYNQTAALFKNLDTGQQDTILDNIQNIGQTIATTAGNFIQSFFQNIPGIISWIPNTATVLVFSALATFFISKDWYRLSNLSNKLLPDKVYVSTIRIIKDLKRALFGFIKAQFTLVSITTVTVLIGLLFLKVRYSITIALICGLVDIVPYLGTGTIFIPWIIYEFISGNTSLGIGLSVLYTIVIVQRQLIEPKVLSSSIGLDPLATLVALFVGYKMIGILGLIAGPVTLVIINTLQRANIFKDIWSFIIGKEGRRDNL